MKSFEKVEGKFEKCEKFGGEENKKTSFIF